ncbi:MAG: polysaccharide biosynthesis tyrosine autokinase [Verrucomicrobia bacterium]|nr:polysaccharide biosynthesis tyrosine autokinase [Verrucomicrobiota bacterium]
MENPAFTEASGPSAFGADLTGETINLRHYWHVVLERRWLVLTAFVVVFALCLIYLFKATPIYRAMARLQIDREQENILSLQDILPLAAPEQDYLQTQYKNLQSRSLIEKVIEDLHLKEDPHYAKARDLVKAVGGDITIAPIRLSRLVDIQVEHPNPRQAMAIANDLARSFIDDNLSKKITNSLASYRWLSQEGSNLQAKVQMDEAAVQNYLDTNHMASLDDQQNILLQSLKEAQQELDKAEIDASVAVNAEDQVKLFLRSGVPLYSIPQITSDTLIQDLKKNLAVAEAELSDLRTRYKEKYPTVIEVSQSVASFKQSIGERATNILESINNRAIVAQVIADDLRKLVKAKEDDILALGKMRIKYEQLRVQAAQDKQLYTNVFAKQMETQMAARTKANNIELQSPAFAPLKPVKPRVLLTLFLGVVGGLGAGLGLAFFVNYLDDSIKTQDDVETYLRLPFLGYVPNIKTNSVVERDLQAHLHPQSNAAEGFRTIRATVQLTRNSDKFHVLTVTSAIPSEGKSLLASNLAIVTAQTGLKTLLVDADLRRPSVHKAFQLHSPVGLSAYLASNADGLEELVHATEVPNLDVVCAGAIPSSPSELVGSKRMTQFLQEARKRYDRVFLDCPPVSAVSDPLMIASMSDGVVFVAKFNKIRRDHARRTIQRIQDAGIHILGVVLNDIDFEGKDAYYYSYYYYQNRYYSSHYKTGAAKEQKE